MTNSDAKIKVVLYLTRDDLDGTIKNLMDNLDKAWHNRAKHEALVEALAIKRKRDMHYGLNDRLWKSGITDAQLARDLAAYKGTRPQPPIPGKAIYPDRVPPKA